LALAAPQPGTSWPASDGLGRKLPTHDQTGPVKTDRHVGIFYFVWLGGHSKSGPYDLTEILKDNPANPAFGPNQVFHHWGKPELGYYYSRDPFVLRRHATQLAEAGVDFVALDVTNSFTYDREVAALCQTWSQMRREGNRTPQIAFLLNSNHARVVQQLFEKIYKPGHHSDLWFRWQGKPLLMANPEGLPPEIRSFFTLRRSWAWSKGHRWFGDGQDRWPWLDHSPQTPGWHVKGKPEFVPVAVAQHPISNIGRSHRNGTQPPPGQTQSARGIYFQEQWNHALEIDPEIVFLTGWNEWVAQRFIKEEGKGPGRLAGRTLKTGDSYFVDAYSMEYSRDIEPMHDGYGDNYYYQMIANIRRFKGTPALPTAPPSTSITIDGNFDDWAGVPIHFRDTLHDTVHRDHEGWAGQRYLDSSGRNDIAFTRVVRQQKTVSFLLHTRAPFTAPADDRWMLLLLDADQNPGTGWYGYDYVINRHRPVHGKCSMETIKPDGTTTTVTQIPIAFSDNFLELQIPLLREWTGKPLRFDFHVSDNAPLNRDFFLQGDHAPNRRFNFRYQTGS
jgi:hypothetical protein